MIVTDKKLPAGVDGFEKLIHNRYYYLDKTSFIRQLLEWRGEEDYHPQSWMTITIMENTP